MNVRRPSCVMRWSGRLVSFGMIVLVTSVEAQNAPCPAGTTISGTCANPVLVQSMAQRALVFSQPRISFLGLPLVGRSNGYVDAVRDRDTPTLGVNRPVPIAGPPLSSGTFVGIPAGVDPARLQIGAPFDVVPGGIRIR